MDFWVSISPIVLYRCISTRCSILGVTMPNFDHCSSVSAQRLLFPLCAVTLVVLVDDEEYLSSHRLHTLLQLQDEAKEGHGGVDGSGLVLIRTYNIVGLYEKGNKSLLGEVAGRVNEYHTIKLAQILHQVLDILRVCDAESLYLVLLLLVWVLLVVGLTLLKDGLLTAAVNNDGSLASVYQIVGKQGTQAVVLPTPPFWLANVMIVTSLIINRQFKDEYLFSSLSLAADSGRS